MAQLILKAPYFVNNKVISVSELKTNYLFGINIKDKYGANLPESTYQYNIDVAIREIEKKLAIKLLTQKIVESRDYSIEDMINWGYIPSTYPVKKACALEGFYGNPEDNEPQLIYPPDWLTIKKGNNNDQERYWRQMQIVARGKGVVTNGQNIFPFIYPFVRSFNRVPNYWRISYITGFQVVPEDLTHIIGKIASIGVLNIAGDLVFSNPGITATSLVIDDIFQNIDTAAGPNSTVYSARISQYTKEIEAMWPSVKRFYRGLVIGSL